MKTVAPREQFRQSLAAATVVAAVYAAPALLCIHTAAVSDPDIWWHLRSAEWIMQHHSVPHSDPFSSYGAGKPWAAYSWLFEIGVLSLFQHLGLTGLIVYTTTMVLASTAAMHHLIQRLQPDFSFAALLTFLASLSLWRLDSPRPWHFTILLFILEIDIVMFARRTGRRRELLWLPFIFVLGANTHIQFVDGLIVLAFAAAEALAGRWWGVARTRLDASCMCLAFFASVLTTFLNPYGWRIYNVAAGLALQPGVLEHLRELQAIPFRLLPDYCVLLLTLGAAAALARSRRLPIFETATFAFAVFLSFRSQRDIWLIAAVGSAIIASEIDTGIKERSQLHASGWLQAMALAVLSLFAGFRIMQVNQSSLHAQLAGDLPVRAIEFVKTRGYSGPLYNDYVWGGYLMWALRQPVSIDGRAAFYGDERIDLFGATWNAEPTWHSDPDLTRAGIVIGPVRAPLTQLLRLDPRFRLCFEDKVAAVFIPRDSSKLEATH